MARRHALYRESICDSPRCAPAPSFRPARLRRRSRNWSRCRRQMPHCHGSRTCTLPEPGTNIPRAALLAFGSDVAAAGLAVEAALYASRSDIARPGMQVDVARSGFFNLDISATGAAPHRARDLPRPHVARSSLQANLAVQIRELSRHRIRSVRPHCRACPRSSDRPSRCSCGQSFPRAR